MKRIHYLSGLFISFFILLHLFNHLLSLMGPDVHIEVMTSLRKLYRHFIFESLLNLAVLVQVVSGVKLALKMRKQNLLFWAKLQSYSGLYLAFFFFIHLSAVWAGRLFLNLDTNFYFGVVGLNTFPFNLFFIPYYGLAIIAIFGHLSAVHAKKMSKKVLSASPSQQAYFMLCFGIGIALVTIYGLTGGFTGISIPEAYQVLVGQ